MATGRDGGKLLPYTYLVQILASRRPCKVSALDGARWPFSQTLGVEKGGGERVEIRFRLCYTGAATGIVEGREDIANGLVLCVLTAAVSSLTHGAEPDGMKEIGPGGVQQPAPRGPISFMSSCRARVDER